MTDEEFEKTVERFCDRYCKFPYICKDEEQLHGVCDSCSIVELIEARKKEDKNNGKH